MTLKDHLIAMHGAAMLEDQPNNAWLEYYHERVLGHYWTDEDVLIQDKSFNFSLHRLYKPHTHAHIPDNQIRLLVPTEYHFVRDIEPLRWDDNKEPMQYGEMMSR